ncbi:MAG: SDR family oxidoreductase [Carboxylicivirga sp.]|nr:SDR family oxidoreductase [Carboxylicivirga sp.]
MKDIKNKTVWITGASSGIGEELAILMAQKGAFPVLIARNKEKLQNVKDRCLQFTQKCWMYPMDLSRVDELPDFVQKVINETGSIDILINNAGRSQRSLAIDTPLANDLSIMELNFFSVIALSKLLLPHMINNCHGHIVTISSITGKFGFPWRTAYAASKHALQGYFESLRAELSQTNIKVTLVSPGRVKTNISLHALTENGTSYNQMDKGQQNGLPANVCAKRIVRAIQKNKKDILVGKSELLMVYIRKFLPALFHRMVTKINN